MKKKWESIENKLIPIVFFGILLLIWQIAVEKGSVQPYILPTPTKIVRTFFAILPEMKPHIIVTLAEAIVGFAISIILSIALALLMDNVKLIKKALYPLILVSQTVPIISLAPLFIVWFGFDITPRIIVVVLVCFFPIVVNLLEGFEATDRDTVNLFKAMGASKLMIFMHIKFPNAMGNFFSGLKIAATYSIMGAFIGEWLGGEYGLGVYMTRVKFSFDVAKMFSVILVIVISSIILFKIISIIQHFSMPWVRKD